MTQNPSYCTLEQFGLISTHFRSLSGALLVIFCVKNALRWRTVRVPPLTSRILRCFYTGRSCDFFRKKLLLVFNWQMVQIGTKCVCVMFVSCFNAFLGRFETFFRKRISGAAGAARVPPLTSRILRWFYTGRSGDFFRIFFFPKKNGKWSKSVQNVCV
jgi:hypothetical protein